MGSKEFCHYGCYFGNECMGASREEVVEFLMKHYYGERIWEECDDDHLNALLETLFDEGYTGPTHIKS